MKYKISFTLAELQHLCFLLKKSWDTEVDIIYRAVLKDTFDIAYKALNQPSMRVKCQIHLTHTQCAICLYALNRYDSPFNHVINCLIQNSLPSKIYENG